MMKRFVRSAFFLGVAAAVASASPLPVGSVSDDVGFSEGAAFANGSYTTLEARHLSDFPARVMVLVYFTPW